MSMPRIVCLCGSTRFGAEFAAANYRETLAGKIVLSIGCVTTSDKDLGITPEQKTMLDELHKRKIDLADEVLVLDVGGYVGPSTRGEIVYAEQRGKPIRYLSADGGEDKAGDLVAVLAEVKAELAAELAAEELRAHERSPDGPDDDKLV